MSRQSDIWEYLQGERTGKRANRFEREMLSDPFLYEAVEGLTTVKADHEKIVQQLQKRMKKREGNKTVRLYRWVAAASLLLLAGCKTSFFSFRKNYVPLKQRKTSKNSFLRLQRSFTAL